MEIRNATCGWYSAKYPTSLQSSLASLSRGGWYLDNFVGRVTVKCRREVDNCAIRGLVWMGCGATDGNVT